MWLDKTLVSYSTQILSSGGVRCSLAQNPRLSNVKMNMKKSKDLHTVSIHSSVRQGMLYYSLMFQEEAKRSAESRHWLLGKVGHSLHSVKVLRLCSTLQPQCKFRKMTSFVLGCLRVNFKIELELERSIANNPRRKK